MAQRDETRILCERAHEWSSLRLDGELSELESAGLRAHLERCPACASYDHDVAAVAVVLRETPLVPLRRELPLPRRHAAFRAARVSAAAAVMLVAAGLGGVLASSLGTGPSPTFTVARPTPIADARQLQDMRLAQLEHERAMLQTNGSRTRFGHVT